MDDVILLQGDCLDLLRSVPDASVDMVLADLPYGTTACSWDSIIPLDRLWEQYRRVCTPQAAIVLTATQPFTTTLISSNMRMFRYCWTWVKHCPTGHLNAKRRPLKQTEDIVIFCGGVPPYFPQGVVPTDRLMQNSASDLSRGTGRKSSTVSGAGKMEKMYRQGVTNYPRDVLHFRSCQQNRQHPTQKPVGLMEYLINTYTSGGQTVLDNAMGSGTTGVACINTGRGFVGMELDGGFFQMAKQRIDSATAHRKGI